MSFMLRPRVAFAVVGLLASGCTFITRASVDSAGGEAAGSIEPSISADGRYVAFTSSFPDLVPDDGNSQADIFVRDLLAGTTTRASVDSAGGDPDGNSVQPSISADGRYVAFFSAATDLVPNDSNLASDVFVRDLQAGTTERVSVDTEGLDAETNSVDPSISADGRFVAFTSVAADLVPDDSNSAEDVFVRDMQAGTTIRASVDSAEEEANFNSSSPSISADGRHVAFGSEASDLVPDDGNSQPDIFVRDLQAGTTARASVDTAGGDPDAGSVFASISGDGRYVAFESDANDLVPNDGNPLEDVFVRDLQAGTTTRASVDSTGGDADARIGQPSISADGRRVAFWGEASDLVPGDGNSTHDVFVRDLLTGTTTRASVDVLGGEASAGSFEPSISADGRYVAFESDANDLVPNDGNASRDIFVRAVVTPTVDSVRPSALQRGQATMLRVRGTGFIAPTQARVQPAEGVTVQSVNVVSETRLRVTVSVDGAAPTGTRDLVVFPLGTGPGTLATGFGFCFGCLTVT
jgi:Tol biopolymer transport system component